jgi:hypothetical protein
MAKRLLPAVPAVLFAVAMIGALALGFWLVPAVWMPVAAALLLLRRGLGRTPWLVLLFVVVAACPIFVFEGGLLVFPAALALLISDGLGRRSHAAVSV